VPPTIESQHGSSSADGSGWGWILFFPRGASRVGEGGPASARPARSVSPGWGVRCARGAAAGGGHTCIHEAGLRAVRSAALFDGPIRDGLHALKYRRGLGLAQAMAEVLGRLWGGLEWRVDVLVPVPLSAKRLGERGYNQAALVAHAFGERIGLPVRENPLKRSWETASQVGLSLTECHLNVAGACALREAGARAVFAITVARAASPSAPRPGCALPTGQALPAIAHNRR